MKKDRAKQAKLELMVGLFMFLILSALAYFTIILSFDNIFTKTYQIRVKFADVTGLITGDKVYVQGVDVGRVSVMTIERDGVVVELTLKYRLDLREDYEISVESSSVLGGKYVAIKQGSETQPKVSGDSLLKGTAPIDFITEASDAILAIRKALEEGGILKNLEISMANVRQLTEGLAEGRGTFGKLLYEDTLYNDFEAITKSLKNLTGTLERGEGTIGKLMQDETVYENFRAVSGDLAEITARLAAGEGTMGRLLSSDDTLYQDLASAVSSLEEVTGKVGAGEGSLGKMLTDDALYNELMSALNEVRAMVDDIRETSPFTTFGSLFLGAF
ncbi:MAG: MCE family protein [Verrucomicrobia bacterium]|nr:MCE family protein [Verrucomicrobiota bacterium]